MRDRRGAKAATGDSASLDESRSPAVEPRPPGLRRNRDEKTKSPCCSRCCRSSHGLFIAFLVVAAVLVLCLIVAANHFNSQGAGSTPRALTPFPGALVSDMPQDNRYSAIRVRKAINSQGMLGDGATYGRQDIVDQGIGITTSFLKHRDSFSGYGGDWAVRVQVVETPSERPNLWSVLWDSATNTPNLTQLVWQVLEMQILGAVTWSY